MFNHTEASVETQDVRGLFENKLYRWIQPLLGSLNECVDRRLVKPLLGLVMAIVLHRHRNHGLLLSELGTYLLGPERCRAGAKRISNLLHCEKWQSEQIEQFLWECGTHRVDELQTAGEMPLVL